MLALNSYLKNISHFNIIPNQIILIFPKLHSPSAKQNYLEIVECSLELIFTTEADEMREDVLEVVDEDLSAVNI